MNDRQQTSDEWTEIVQQRAMTDHAQQEIIAAGDPNFFAEVLWEKAVGVCVGENCARQFISRERFDSVIVPALTQARVQGRREALEEIMLDVCVLCREGYPLQPNGLLTRYNGIEADPDGAYVYYDDAIQIITQQAQEITKFKQERSGCARR